jgi:hypothetical protein
VNHLRGTLDRGRLVWLDQAINFKGLREATEAAWKGEEAPRYIADATPVG